MAKNSYPSSTTWWALQIKSRSWRFKNLLTTSAPKVNETPRSFSDHPCTSLSGSDHSRSHSRPEGQIHIFWLTSIKDYLRNLNSPVSGTSVGLMMRFIWSMFCKSGLKPPWQQNIFSSIMAAMGRQLKQSVKVFHNLMLYRRLPKINIESKVHLQFTTTYIRLKLDLLTLIVETINSVDRRAFVISS